MDASPDRIVWSCGGGVQSTAIAALICKGLLPKPDTAVMVDVGYERESTWKWVHGLLVPELAKAGVKLNIIKSVDWSNNDLIQSGIVALPAYKVTQGGKVAKCMTACNGAWKVMAVRRFIRSLGYFKVTNWLGMDLDEKRRIHEHRSKSIRVAYPLADLGMGRRDCHDVIRQMGWPPAPKTACYCCPGAHDEDWRNLSIGDKHRAIEVEKKIQEHNPSIYLHRTIRPIQDVFASFDANWDGNGVGDIKSLVHLRYPALEVLFKHTEENQVRGSL